LNFVNSQLLRVSAAAAANTSPSALNPDITLRTLSYPFAESAASVAQARASALSENAPFVILALISGLAVIPAVAAGILGREVEVGAKRQQLRAGASPSAFWAATWVLDCAASIPAIAAVLIALASFGPERISLASSDSGRRDAVAALLLLYIPAALGATYALGIVVRGAQSASILTLGLNIVGAVLAVAQNSLRGAPATCDMSIRAAGALRYLLPSFALGEGLIAVATLDNLSYQLVACGYSSSSAEIVSALAPQAAGVPCIALGIMAVVWVLLAYGADAIPRQRAFRRLAAQARSGCCKIKAAPASIIASSARLPEDPDVAFERAHVLELLDAGSGVHAGPVPAYNVLLDRVRVEYGPELAAMLAARLSGKPGPTSLIALDALSLAVPAGRSFSLIGSNGAGKSTAMGVMSGSARPTKGVAYAGGLDVSSADAGEVGLGVGFCPRHDPLLGALSAEEHLQLYARIAGVPGDTVIRGVVQRAIRDFDLTNHAHTIASAMSGGTKRKLCVASAFIGSPRVVATR